MGFPSLCSIGAMFGGLVVLPGPCHCCGPVLRGLGRTTSSVGVIPGYLVCSSALHLLALHWHSEWLVCSIPPDSGWGWLLQWLARLHQVLPWRDICVVCLRAIVWQLLLGGPFLLGPPAPYLVLLAQHWLVLWPLRSLQAGWPLFFWPSSHFRVSRVPVGGASLTFAFFAWLPSCHMLGFAQLSLFVCFLFSFSCSWLWW